MIFAKEFVFFHDPQDRPFVRLKIKGHTEVWPVESTKFRKLLARIFYKRTGAAINRNALADAITYNPHGPYFVVNFIGEQGTAKSCAAKILRMLVDPNENPMRSPPRDERDLIAQAASNRCVSFDNLSTLPGWLSDALCRLSTGGGHSARQLYTDLEEVSLNVKRPVILNGIEDVATRPDLSERALQIELERIDDNKRT